MGFYINPGNKGFQDILNDTYVDKTGLIGFVNDTINTPRRLTCVSRPRRFGKSFAAKMLVAYYDRTCDSKKLFDKLDISSYGSYRDNINQYDIIYLDISGVIGRIGGTHGLVEEIKQILINELRAEFPDAPRDNSLDGTLLHIVEHTGRQFICVIDEWDAVFREARGTIEAQLGEQEDYILMLRTLFKNANVTDRVFAAVYMTGILPIKKYGTQSAISDFNEYTMVMPGKLAPYTGFTDNEVEGLCRSFDIDFDQMRQWYDGYSLPGVSHIYSPSSVMKAIQNRVFDTYWSSSETYESLRDYIDMDFDGLQQKIIQMLGDAQVPVNTARFQNDMSAIGSADDVLTLLIHLGYLAFDRDTRRARIPNEEVRIEFINAIEAGRHAQSARIIKDSEKLLRATLDGDEREVANLIGQAHDAGTAPLYYNDEQALRAVVKAAYIVAVDDYVRIEELPSGHGYADLVYLPKRTSPLPALVIELKWDKPVDGAIEQIEDRNYPQVLRDFESDVLLVGVSYDSKTKKHTCALKRMGMLA